MPFPPPQVHTARGGDNHSSLQLARQMLEKARDVARAIQARPDGAAFADDKSDVQIAMQVGWVDA